jgi:GNAT superfamily N-acetyltransferase
MNVGTAGTGATWKATLGRLRHTPPLLLVQKALRKVPFRPVDVGKLCFLRLDEVPRVPASRLRGAGWIRPGSRADLDALTALRDQRESFVERFDQGDHCMVAEVDGRIVGYEWFCAGSTHREESWGYRITIPEGFVYAYDAYIDPRYRNTGVWLKFKAYLGGWMAESGKRGVLTFVDYGNRASLGTHLRFGFRPALNVLALKVLGLLVSMNLDVL